MRLSEQLFATFRDDPADADARSHALLVRSGMLMKLTSGVYVFGPLLTRVLRRIEAIVREELDREGCQELRMPALQPRELWEESGRWDRYVHEGILFTLADRRGAELCLGPTHEEVVTAFVRQRVGSHRQLPLVLYQIQTKFRDEIRPRFGLLRGREFVMKDAYSFDASGEGMRRSYERQREVYRRILTRCGLRFTPVAADPGAIGGSASEEFMVDAATGEDAIAVCRATGYAANVEAATSRIPPPPPPPDERPMRAESTPGARSIADLRALFPALPVERMVKTLLYRATRRDGEQLVAVLVRGDRDLNEVKLANELGALGVELAGDDLVARATGSAPGFAGPIGLAEGVRVLADRSVEGVAGFLCGANQTDTHYLDVWFGRDLPQPETADLGLVRDGDLAPDGEGTIEITRGIEVGHIFQLGTKYAQAMGATFLDEHGDARPLWMGCYGLGITRVAAAAVEQHHDDAGIVWPLPIAPHSVLVVQLRPGEKAQDAVAAELYDRLTAAGVDVLLDDRADVRPGVRFYDADLVGVPIRLVVGRDAGAGRVEFKLRAGGDAEVVAIGEAVERAIARVRKAQVPAL